MTLAPFFHVGILVPDLNVAAARLTEVLGITFRDPVVQDCDHFEDGGRTSQLSLHLTYSVDGPPYYELIEAQGDGLYGLKHGQGLHHIGMWEPDCEAKAEELESDGMRREGALYRPDNSMIVAFYQPSGLAGVRLEIADEGMKEDHERWLAGGEFIR